jgi:hypothetical protein
MPVAIRPRQALEDAVDPLDGDHITVHPVEDPVLADAKPVVLASVERILRIRVIGQGINRGDDRAHAVLVAYEPQR